MDNDWDELDVYQQLHKKCIALRALIQGLEAPIGCPQEIWNCTIKNAWICFNTPIKGLDKE